jgi:hypothetical protein
MRAEEALITAKYAHERAEREREHRDRERRVQIAQQVMRRVQFAAALALGGGVERGLKRAHPPDLFGLDGLLNEERAE